jgi:hypothetical protein
MNDDMILADLRANTENLRAKVAAEADQSEQESQALVIPSTPMGPSPMYDAYKHIMMLDAMLTYIKKM